jgi:hypothetical protein
MSAALSLGVLTAAVTDASSQDARIYKWCAIYSGARGGAQNCGFDTLQQCRATVSGVGGFCNVNPFWNPPPGHGTKRLRD